MRRLDEADRVVLDGPRDGDLPHEELNVIVYDRVATRVPPTGGHYPKRVAGAMNDTQFDVKRDGSFEVLLGPGLSGRNKLALEK